MTVESKGRHAGMDWECVMTRMGHRCGYVRIPTGHPLFGLSYNAAAPGVTMADLDEQPVGKRGVIPLLIATIENAPSVGVLFDVHGSLTFGAPRHTDGDWWLGFDCAHAGDAKDLARIEDPKLRTILGRFDDGGTVRTQEYVETECRSLIEQIHARYGEPEARP